MSEAKATDDSLRSHLSDLPSTRPSLDLLFEAAFVEGKTAMVRKLIDEFRDRSCSRTELVDFIKAEISALHQEACALHAKWKEQQTGPRGK